MRAYGGDEAKLLLEMYSGKCTWEGKVTSCNQRNLNQRSEKYLHNYGSQTLKQGPREVQVSWLEIIKIQLAKALSFLL